MSASFNIQADSLNGLAAAINTLSGKETADSVRKAMGGAVRLELIEHFSELEADSLHHRTADRLGAEHSGFYADAARSVQMPKLENEGVSIAINKLGLALRYYGGRVTPGKSTSWKTGRATQWLTIPNDADAYGRRTQEFDYSGRGLGNLRFVFFRAGLAGLVENLATNVKRVRGVYKPVSSTIGKVIFWLKKEVTYKADPSVLPTSGEMTAAAVEAGEMQLVNIWDRQIGATT